MSECKVRATGAGGDDRPRQAIVLADIDVILVNFQVPLDHDKRAHHRSRETGNGSAFGKREIRRLTIYDIVQVQYLNE